MNKHKLLFVGFILALGLMLVSCAAAENEPAASESPEAVVQAPAAVIAEGTIKPLRSVYLAFQSPGTVRRLGVALGDRVTAGQVLARLSTADQAAAQLSAARLELLSAQQALDTLERTGGANQAAAWMGLMDAQIARAAAQRAWERLNLDSLEDRIDDALADVADRQADLDEARQDFDKYANLDEDNANRKRAEDDLERTQEDYNEAVRDLEALQRQRDSVRAALDAALAAEAEAQYQYEISSEGANADVLSLVQARLENAQRQVAAAEDLLSSYQITAPFDGIVTDLNIHLGDQVAPGAWAVSIADLSAWTIESSDVTELEIVRIFVGQQVTFTADAFPEVQMKGVVVEIGQSPLMRAGDVTYTVRITPDPAELDPRVMWGMTVELVFEPED